MHETEITAIPPLSAAELSVVNCHALLNLYNVVHGELELLGMNLANDTCLLAASLVECEARIGRLGEPGEALRDAAKAHEFRAGIQREIELQLRVHRGHANHPTVAASCARLDSLLWILQVRAHELLARAAAPDHWSHFTAAELEADFHELFRSMEENSRGRYRFVYNLALQGPDDYYVDLRFESARGGSISMPAVLKDVMRDLVANARKYTNPGGQVHAALHCSADGLRFVVEDTGRGIPIGDLDAVVHYGRRGSNVGEVRTLGAGCGLTKAFLVTRQLGGRFWIASEEGRGTKIRLWVPARLATSAGAAFSE